MISKREQKFIDEAYDQAQNSKMLCRHGCVCVINGKIVSSGYNNYRTHSCTKLIDGCSCHAEMDAIRKILIKVSSAKGPLKGQTFLQENGGVRSSFNDRQHSRLIFAV